MDRNLISQRQGNALKLGVLREYFDFRAGRPTTEMVAVRSCEVPVRQPPICAKIENLVAKHDQT